MHLIFENLVLNLIQLWTHDFKDLGSTNDPFVIRPTIWQAVGAATASCGPTIPYSFCSRPQNIATDKSQCTADAWSFWLQYIAPVVLENRFTEDKYYWHFVMTMPNSGSYPVTPVALQLYSSTPVVHSYSGHGRAVILPLSTILGLYSIHSLPHLAVYPARS